MTDIPPHGRFRDSQNPEEMPPPKSAEHDTAIRNVTLDGIIKAINEDIEYEDYCIKTFDTQINRIQKAILSQVVEKIESLRGEP